MEIDKKEELLKKLRDHKPEYNPPKGLFDETYIKGIEALEKSNEE